MKFGPGSPDPIKLFRRKYTFPLQEGVDDIRCHLRTAAADRLVHQGQDLAERRTQPFRERELDALGLACLVLEYTASV